MEGYPQRRKRLASQGGRTFSARFPASARSARERWALFRTVSTLHRSIALSHLGRRKTGGEFSPTHPFGRGAIVTEFHRLRRLDEPYVLVLVGVRGSQKSELVEHLRQSYARRKAWWARSEREAKVDFIAVDPEPGSTFGSLRTQLAAERNWFRPLRFPRFGRIEELLTEELRAAGHPVGHVDALESDLGWLARQGVGVASQIAGTPLPAPPRFSAAVRAVRKAWWHVSWTKAGRWARRFERALPDPTGRPDSRRRRLELLREGLGAAFAEDLTRATRRRALPVDQVTIFADGHQRVERSAQPAFMVDFARLLAESRARVMMVVACREEERWSRFAESQSDYEDVGVVKQGKGVQIRHLQPIGWEDRVETLRNYRVPAPMIEELARASAGVPLALSLLGSAFGDVEEPGVPLRSMLEELPAPERIDGDWFAKFSHVLAREMVDGLDRDLELHLRAAATVRNFDRQLLKALLDKRFRDDCFDTLVSERFRFVGTPRPSAILGVEKSYRVRSFVRDILTADPGHRTAVEGWHRDAAEYLTRLARDSSQGGR